jgi:hypothetical protein
LFHRHTAATETKAQGRENEEGKEMMDYFYADEVDIADLKAEAAAQRKAANRICPECNMRGTHLNGCPEISDADDEEGDE